ncbi:natural killer cells antigen CD94-like [Ursus arctos]|uniref:natural killer cells antigen CD94-like n=1 Tax=Ursus arctos TaxID=9644 RepID=UPI001CF9072C|nr:natural killer cells antigen CD94-like [Ursus arctos]
MSNATDSEQPPEITEETETIPIADLEPSPDLPPPPPSLPPPAEDEQSPISEPTKMNAASFSFSLLGLVPVILGLFSLLLLMLCGFFGYQYFQTVETSAIRMKILQEQIESSRNETEIRIQKVLDQNKETLERLQSQKDSLIEDLRELKEKLGVKHGPSLNHWVRFEDHCYHQTMEMVPWLSCSDLCVSLNATFLKTGGSRLKNIMELVTGNHTWLGLSYKKEDNEWKWEDGSSPSSELDLPKPSLDFQGKCVYMNSHTVGTDNCTRSSSCLCEKTIH